MAVISFNTIGAGAGSSAGFMNAGKTVQRAISQLSSGKRITSASIDAAGLAIAANLESNIATISQASRNAGDVSSALSIADGALEQVSNITTRLQEIAITSANGVYSDEQRAALQGEYEALTSEIQRIGESTTFNGRRLLDGSSMSAELGGSSISVGGLNLSELASSLASQNVSSAAAAQSAMAAVQNFSDNLTTQRGQSVDAGLSRLGSVQDTLGNAKLVNQQAFSQVSDVDVGTAASDLSRAKVLMQYQASTLSSMNSLQTSLIKQLTA